MSDTFDRSQLDGKDREQLSEIASALGVKSISRMRKAELVDAIVKATAGANGATTTEESKPRRIRSTRAAGADDFASIAEEENELANSGQTEDDMALIRPRRRPSSGGNGASTSTTRETQPSFSTAPTEPEQASPQPREDSSSAEPSETSTRSSGADLATAPAREHGQPWREEDPGNRRRRRRRGRDRERGDQREPRTDEYSGDLIDIEGLLDLREEGYGFLRTSGYLPGRNDAYVSASQVRRFGLRKGDYVKGATRPPASSEKYPALVRVDLINGMTPDEARSRVRFEDLTPLFPDSKLRLELDGDPGEITGRIIDIISPIGKGQRGMIVSPPKAGKTTIIKQIVYSIERNNPETHVMVLLVDERPEEVTDMRRHVLNADVVASTFDRPSDEHCHVAELAIERAKRLVEMGKDVVIILDGIPRLARACTLAAPGAGRLLSGGIGAVAL